MAVKKLSVILDTILWISFLIKKDYVQLQQFLISGELVLLFSSELFEEFVTVTQRPKLQKYFAMSDVLSLISLIDNFAAFINVTTEVDVCRDKKDNFLLALATDGKADYLVTGDQDLLVLERHNNTKVVTITDLLNILIP